MNKWIREHLPTVSVLLAIFGAIVLGIVLGGIFAFLSGFWLVVSGEMGDMVLTAWGY
jgi:hypothetical protein